MPSRGPAAGVHRLLPRRLRPVENRIIRRSRSDSLQIGPRHRRRLFRGCVVCCFPAQ
ncbi:hypothetical protein PHJA_002941400 [Phtheirospermum japonicum]|uniref:Uncharacterized protein n=1 Tax=Phtheirospermum japonicum TaxID=374723 RepID=A0A830DKC9_9LAMI|nr:hypothetical protein PHJA_002941400 [Phtheirospermum japonicum]